MHTLTYLVSQDNPRDTLRVPEQLVDVVVPNDLVMVTLLPHELAVHNLVPLVPDETVERFHDGMEIEALGDGLHPVLTLW